MNRQLKILSRFAYKSCKNDEERNLVEQLKQGLVNHTVQDVETVKMLNGIHSTVDELITDFVIALTIACGDEEDAKELLAMVTTVRQSVKDKNLS